MYNYVSASGWWVASVICTWREDAADVREGTVIANIEYGDWTPVAMWRMEGDDHSSAVPIVVEDGRKFVYMEAKQYPHQDFGYVLKYSPSGEPEKLERKDIIKE